MLLDRGTYWNFLTQVCDAIVSYKILDVYNLYLTPLENVRIFSRKKKKLGGRTISTLKIGTVV